MDVAVHGIYRGLFRRPPSGYWLAWGNDIYPKCAFCPLPPQLILADPEQLITLSQTLGRPSATLPMAGAARRGRRPDVGAGAGARGFREVVSEVSRPTSAVQAPGRLLEAAGIIVAALIVVGSACWFAFLSAAVALSRQLVGGPLLRWAMAAASLLILAFAVRFLIQGLDEYVL